ncbi:hypothetical protein PNOK_0797000 [Pyrrhoderma noxium]|uniref:Uncharacterized protein n=1 Tax=Pyrrhoderma noxium TaxID=2282107 RepID=A0A286U9U7_9AGAM|nr:hypothetical protein PNOK_0797000 [Pyrrhoderma noxium]
MTTILGYDSVGNEYTGSAPTLSLRIREKNQNIFPTVTTHHSYRSSVSSGPSTGGGTFEDVFPDQFGTLLSSGDMAQVRRLSNIHRMGKLHREINSQMSSWESVRKSSSSLEVACSETRHSSPGTEDMGDNYSIQYVGGYEYDATSIGEFTVPGNVGVQAIESIRNVTEETHTTKTHSKREKIKRFFKGLFCLRDPDRHDDPMIKESLSDWDVSIFALPPPVLGDRNY